jgi:hypothetical protein
MYRTDVSVSNSRLPGPATYTRPTKCSPRPLKVPTQRAHARVLAPRLIKVVEGTVLRPCIHRSANPHYVPWATIYLQQRSALVALCQLSPHLFRNWLSLLPFHLSSSSRAALNQILRYLRSPRPRQPPIQSFRQAPADIT